MFRVLIQPFFPIRFPPCCLSMEVFQPKVYYITWLGKKKQKRVIALKSLSKHLSRVSKDFILLSSPLSLFLSFSHVS